MNLARIKSFRELPPFRTDLTSFLLFPRLPLRTRRGRRSLLLPHPFILRRKSAVLLDFALTRERVADMNFVTYSRNPPWEKGWAEPGVAIEQKRGEIMKLDGWTAMLDERHLLFCCVFHSLTRLGPDLICV